MMTMNKMPYYLGMPLWANANWKGSLFSTAAKPVEFLAQYATVFNAVEGNTTFYSVPAEKMVARWCEATPESFRFSFKLPRTITHQRHLIHAGRELEEFLRRMQPLGERLHGMMVQLPAAFSPGEMPILETFLRQLPADYHYAVEVRHPAFFTDKAARNRYNALLTELKVDRVIFESRPLHAAQPLDAATLEAQQRKPRLPVQLDATAGRPVLRYIGHPQVDANHAWLDRWVAQTARWLEAGKRPRIFLHTPDNNLAPELARMFHRQLQDRIPGLPDLPTASGAVQNTLL